MAEKLPSPVPVPPAEPVPTDSALRRALHVFAQLLVIGFFALLAWVGASIMPVLATDALVSLPQVPMSLVQSVIPISALLIVVAETMHLVTLLGQARHPLADADAPGVKALQ